MKKGDMVVAHDLSWAKAIKNGKLVSPTRDVHMNFKTSPAIVIETNCRFPLGDGFNYEPEEHRRNTVIQVVNTGEVIFVHDSFLHPVKYKIAFVGGILDGTVIEISDEFYEKLQRLV